MNVRERKQGQKKIYIHIKNEQHCDTRWKSICNCLGIVYTTTGNSSNYPKRSYWQSIRYKKWEKNCHLLLCLISLQKTHTYLLTLYASSVLPCIYCITTWTSRSQKICLCWIQKKFLSLHTFLVPRLELHLYWILGISKTIAGSTMFYCNGIFLYHLIL